MARSQTTRRQKNIARLIRERRQGQRERLQASPTKKSQNLRSF